MSTQELKELFNVLYDNIASKGAPGLDDFEISLFLTMAQEELVKNKDEYKSNKLQEGFENSSKRRTDLKQLIKNYSTSETLDIEGSINDNSKFYEIPEDVFLIKSEKVTLNDPNCGVVTATVVPKTHDEYNIQINNPFKKPSKNTVWRMDFSSTEPGQNIVELISNLNIVKYDLRYIKKPNPIILTDLTAGDFEDENLTILGQTQQQTSELDSSVHSEIVRRAVELATLSFKENNLQNIVNLYQRKE